MPAPSWGGAIAREDGEVVVPGSMTRFPLLVASIFLLLIWGAYFFVMVGVLPSPSILSQLKAPATMAELGDSLGVVNGLMSSLAVILALQTLVSQRRDSMRAGEEQAKYQEFLLEQLTIQTLSSRQSYLMGEEERLQGILDRTAGELRHEQLRGNVMRRKSRVLSELKDVEETLRDRLYR